MNGKRAGQIIALVVNSIVLMSCSVVLEDRRDCPCALSVVMEGLPEYPVWLYVNDSLSGVALSDTTLLVRVERGAEASVLALSGSRLNDDGRVIIPYGDPCPPLYVFSSRADCSHETGLVEVRMHRHFSTLSLSFGGAADDVPFRAEVRGCVDGLSIPDGTPLPGDFHCRLDDSLSCRLPRQRPTDQLWLDIVLGDGVLRSFPLDASLRLSDYDWDAPDLEDISLQVDLSVTEIDYHFGVWDSSFPLKISI